MQNPPSKEIYEMANGFVEKWTKIIYFFLSKIAAQSIMGAFAILSYGLYFTTDLKEKAFLLPFETWYAIYFSAIFMHQVKCMMIEYKFNFNCV